MASAVASLHSPLFTSTGHHNNGTRVLSPIPSSSAMDPTRQPALPIRRGPGKEVPFSEKPAQQTASAQPRYVTVLSPPLPVKPTQQDARATPRELSPSHQDVQGVEVPLPRQLSHHIPPQSSRYVRMLLQLDQIPRLHNVLANSFTWLLLAGYIVFPVTFTSLKRSNAIKNTANGDETEHNILDKVQNVPLLWVAAICCVIGASGISCLWWRWSENFVWLVNRIFL